MKFTRNAKAQWKGSGKDGSGTLSTPSTILDNTKYSFKTRFEGDPGTNPEELLGAAHAGCFAMQLSFLLQEAEFVADTLDVNATIHFEDGNIPNIDLDLTAEVPDISAEEFNQLANKAKEICPISKVLKAEIGLQINLKN
ncbi:OsmC family protein [Gilvibacter sediminis]|uniref:OsmC family protein n=1 Tax=Gilvibacter sediminis TaxID=379071 RepID=UPI0023508A99|nr:OsmC family protein [Gilvibacter sediminis]MDC7998304.1 OsmC family protein [Gilvibacter sediminis]